MCKFITSKLHTQATRGNHLKFIQPVTIDAYKFSFYPNVIQLWNNLPDYIVSAQSLDFLKCYSQPQHM